MNESATLEENEVELPRQYKDFPSELEDINSIGINYTDLTTPELKEDTFGERLRKSRLELGLSISEVASLCGVTKSIISGYELNRYTPTKEVLDLLSSKFDMTYLCIEGYTKLLYSFDNFLDKLSLWINENSLTRLDAASKLGISHGLFRFWFNGGVISISTYNKIEARLKKYQLLE